MLRVRRHAQNRYKAEQKKDSKKKTYMNITCTRLAYTHTMVLCTNWSTVMSNEAPAVCE